jgi:hypothetical protein
MVSSTCKNDILSSVKALFTSWLNTGIGSASTCGLETVHLC